VHGIVISKSLGTKTKAGESGDKQNNSRTTMKKLVAVIGMLAVGAVAYGQGTVNFVNGWPGGSAPVSQFGGALVPVGNGFTAQLLAGASADSLTPAGTDSMNWVAPGIFNGGIKEIATVAPGSSAWLKVQVWENQGGTIASYAAAAAAGAQFGESLAWQSANLGGGTPPAAPPTLVGMTSFSLVPEPSTYALLALGAAALFLRRRK
jgi:hypothetical protein